MIADMEANIKLKPIVTESFLWEKKLCKDCACFLSILFQSVWNYKTIQHIILSWIHLTRQNFRK